MLRSYAVVGASLLCVSCATSPPSTLPPQTLQTVHLLQLEKPGGSSGQLKLIKKTEYKPNTFRLGTDKRDYYAVISYTAEGAIRAADDAIEWTFTYSRLGIQRARSLRTSDLEIGVLGLGLQARNRTQDVIEIDWNRTVLVDPSGRTERIIHKSVKFADRSSSSVPSIIPPGAGLEDFLYPSEGIFFESGQYGGWRAPGYFDQLRVGSRIGLTVATKRGERITTKSFTFLVQGPE